MKYEDLKEFDENEVMDFTGLTISGKEMNELDRIYEEKKSGETSKKSRKVKEPQTAAAEIQAAPVISPEAAEKTAGSEQKNTQEEPAVKSIKASFEITDPLIINRIKRLNELPKYMKKNIMLQDACEIGLTIMEAREFHELNPEELKKVTVDRISVMDESISKNILRILNEICISAVSIKGMVSTLYNEKKEELKGVKVTPEIYDLGVLSDLPERYEKYENEELKKIKDNLT